MSRQPRNGPSESPSKKLIAMAEVTKDNHEQLAKELYQMAMAAKVMPDWTPANDKEYGMFKEALGGKISDADRKMINQCRKDGMTDESINAALKDW